MTNRNCPQCGNPLTRVTQSSNSPPNRYQWEASIAGNWYCTTCPGNGRGKSNLCYFWERELEQLEPFPLIGGGE